MSDSTRHDLEDRYVRGELTAAEARELAQKSLDDPELFENLTFSALAKAAVAAPVAGQHLEHRGSGPRVIQFSRRARVWIAAAAAAAAIVLVSLYSVRSSLSRQNPSTPAQSQSHETSTASRLTPALPSSAKPGQPLLLASDLQPALTRREGADVFRSPEPDSRPPRATGSIISIEDGVAAIDLGSLDGLAKGSELEVFLDGRSTQPVGRLRVTTVFRERARTQILARQTIGMNNQVRVPAAVYLGALLQQVDALSARGDSAAARATAEKAAGWAETANVPPGEGRTALERLAALEYQAGSLQAAEKHYQSAVDGLNAALAASAFEESAVLNNLAVLHMLRGDYDGAEAPLSRAVSNPAKTDSAYGRSLNNLGVLAELRGDRRKAESFYTEGLHAFAGISNSSEQDRRAVETNLSRLKGSR